MRLALQTDYALRTLIFLAHQGERAKVADVSSFYGVSPAHVAKVVNLLSRHGYIRSVRGVGGGIELARPAAEISVGEVIRQFEGNMHLLECVGTENVCVIQPFCKLKTVLSEAERIQQEYLNNVTLADILPNRKQVYQLLSTL
ncbi:MAG: Rrf2 family transcriptional regulator [Planctomycetota bacterium]|nr:Rrf2 family transcriptional regulator [Planctomycetota bacterium]MDA1212242.1 Rrf2 family transcriptional regulator [Planctomycetota bacterium]